MNAALQKATGLPTGKNRQDLNTAKISNPTGIVKNPDRGEDFRSVLLNSNYEEKKTREADAKGDLAGAKNYEDFLERLNRQTQQKDAPKNNLDKDDFLKLFVTQLQSQDPLNPQDGSQMAAQLAQFNSLEQMLNVNKTLEKMVDIQNSGKALQYVNYIGKELSVNGGSVRLDNGKTNDIYMSSDSPLGESSLKVKDSFGKIVAERNLGALDSGQHKIIWDGKDNNGRNLPNGKYSFDITGRSGKGDPVDVKMSSKVVVTGVDLGESGDNVFTSIGTVPFDQIQAVGSIGFNSAKIKEAQALAKVKPMTASDAQNLQQGDDTNQLNGEQSNNERLENDSEATTQRIDSVTGSNGAYGNENSGDNLYQDNTAESASSEGDSLIKNQLNNARTNEENRLEVSSIDLMRVKSNSDGESSNQPSGKLESIPPSEIPPEIRNALQSKFGSEKNSPALLNSPDKKGRISVSNPPTPMRQRG